MNSLLGMWQLKSLYSLDPKGNKVDVFGANPQGWIIYLPNGYMATEHGSRDRAKGGIYLPEEIMSGEEAVQIIKNYMSYSGRYEIKSHDTVHHHVEIALLPSWIGTTQERKFKLEGNELIITALLPSKAGQNEYKVHWELLSRWA